MKNIVVTSLLASLFPIKVCSIRAIEKEESSYNIDETTTNVSHQRSLITGTGGNIVGGITTEDRGLCPFFVRINGEGGHILCGGSLVAPNVVLCAAHCSEYIDLTEEKYSVQVWGEQDITANIVEVRKHPDFEALNNGQFYTSDCMLLKLDKEFRYVPLMELRGELVDETVELEILGQGYHGTGYHDHNKLVHATTKYVPTEECSTDYQEWVGIDGTMLCSSDGDPNTNIDTCFGDSGGPIMIKNGDDMCNGQQVGITSFGPDECGSNLYPGVYCRVSSVFEWIRKNVCVLAGDIPKKPWFCNECGNGNPTATVTFIKSEGSAPITRVCSLFMQDSQKQYCNFLDLTPNRSPALQKIWRVCYHECMSRCHGGGRTSRNRSRHRTRTRSS